MRSPYYPQRRGPRVLASVKAANAQKVRDSGFDRAVTVTIGHIDLPGFVSNGQLYVQTPLPLIFQAFAENVSDFVRDMEVRVSIEGGGSLPLDSNGRAILGETMVEPSVVSDSGF